MYVCVTSQADPRVKWPSMSADFAVNTRAFIQVMLYCGRISQQTDLDEGLSTVQYNLVDFRLQPLYTWILADINGEWHTGIAPVALDR